MATTVWRGEPNFGGAFEVRDHRRKGGGIAVLNGLQQLFGLNLELPQVGPIDVELHVNLRGLVCDPRSDTNKGLGCT